MSEVNLDNWTSQVLGVMGPTRERKSTKRALKAGKAGAEVSIAITQLEDCTFTDSTVASAQVTSVAASSSISKRLSVPNPSTKTSNWSLRTLHSINSTTSTTSSSSPPITQIYDASLIEVRHTPDKGYALFTSRRIPAGTLILAEAPIIRLTAAEESSPSISVEDILAQRFQALPKSCQKTYLKLHDSEKASFSRIKSIYFSNCYDLGKLDTGSAYGGSAIGLLASRINHSCIPNVQFSFADTVPSHLSHLVSDIDQRDASNGPRPGLMLFHTLRTLPANRELSSNYESIYLTTAQRQVKQQMYYGFRCVCEACTGETDFWAKSDERRIEMIRLKAQVDKAERRWRRFEGKSHVVSLDDKNDEQQPTSGDTNHPFSENEPGTITPVLDLVPITKDEMLSTLLPALEKLAHLLVKEGLLGMELAHVYKRLAVWSLRANDPTGAATWATKERSVCVIAFGEGSWRVEEVDERMANS